VPIACAVDGRTCQQPSAPDDAFTSVGDDASPDIYDGQPPLVVVGAVGGCATGVYVVDSGAGSTTGGGGGASQPLPA